ncbi:MAG: hypothetical protein JXR40_04805 [Pontiellaceae bacterium]|nr:hypothetical protein [Pontiellaceae bacterium]
MRLIKKIRRDFEMTSMAGFGPTAWNNGSAPLEVPVQEHRRGSRTVTVNHEVRAKDASERSGIRRRRFTFLGEDSNA